MKGSVACSLAWSVVFAAGLAAQNVETDPLQCWWRTSAGAVRVGEPFTAVLTCAVVETDDVKVVVDESRLEPSVVQFAPFETLGGAHSDDLRSGDRRFFQYEYRLRLVAENLFGKDVALPETKLTYRIQSRVGSRSTGSERARQEAIAGRDQTYVLPTLSMRLLSLVPSDATDIRDASSETFSELGQRSFRASALTVIGGVLLVLAALLALLAFIRLFIRARRPFTAADRLVGDGAILRGVGRELNAVQREREANGWSAALAGRALAALRVLGSYAVGRNPSRVAVSAGEPTLDSHRVIVSTGWLRGKRVAVSGSATARSIAAFIAQSPNGDLQSFEQALSHFTIAHYGRNGTLDDGALDESLAAARRLLMRLKVKQLWIVKRLRRGKSAIAGGGRPWPR